jgi:hypothetical protein
MEFSPKIPTTNFSILYVLGPFYILRPPAPRGLLGRRLRQWKRRHPEAGPSFLRDKFHLMPQEHKSNTFPVAIIW